MQLWQHELANAITNPLELIQRLELTERLPPLDERVVKQFACRVPEPYLRRIEKNNPHDPLLKQVLPLNEELELVSGYVVDPLQESTASPQPGFLHKYYGRILIPVTGACAINCRYCFRRHFPYQNHSLSPSRWNTILHYLKSNPSVHEVIFSGGDPLILKDEKIEALLDELQQETRVKTVRFHTRLPIVIPQRSTQKLCSAFERTPLRVVLVVHCNHANELDLEVQKALNQFRQAGVTLLNQSVLLKGVNDQLDALTDLSHALFSCGTLPYYLHLLDKVQGAAHFDIERGRAIKLTQSLRAQLPGYLVPQLAQEIPNQTSKTPIY